MWSTVYSIGDISIYFDSDGVVGFGTRATEPSVQFGNCIVRYTRSTIVDQETIKAIRERDPRIFDALNTILDRNEEIWTVNEIEGWADDEEYYFDQGLRHLNESETITYIDRLTICVNSDLASERLKSLANKWIAIARERLAKLNDKQSKATRTATVDRRGYVYLIRADTGHYKIGRSRNVFDRVKTFEVKLPFEIELIHQIESDDMYLAEGELHNRYSNRRTNGEWFDLCQDDIDYICSLTAYEKGAFLSEAMTA